MSCRVLEMNADGSLKSVGEAVGATWDEMIAALTEP
jgi:hypothetical protein